MAWAFDTVPSQLALIYWSYTYRDLRFRIRIRYGEQQASLTTQFEALCQTASLALGGSKTEDQEPDEDVKVPQTGAELKAMFTKMFS
ncbi:hypothetical protein PU634_10300 [Oceanimonas pelagia]|uniref:Uncharacterized protein n=1 Tax=Oceanimonas pelagia TaxID=3028314 RepID=A0AA50QAX5_9GAMM|nr:hypothetical protein [Oceanimonas pelagia]WMC09506.1 hypothetical protein PU634_10300 [Oceanimonas pelagia]